MQRRLKKEKAAFLLQNSGLDPIKTNPTVILQITIDLCFFMQFPTWILDFS